MAIDRRNLFVMLLPGQAVGPIVETPLFKESPRPGRPICGEPRNLTPHGSR